MSHEAGRAEIRTYRTASSVSLLRSGIGPERPQSLQLLRMPSTFRSEKLIPHISFKGLRARKVTPFYIQRVLDYNEL